MGDFYLPKTGWIHRLDPRAAFLSSVVLVVGLFFIPNLVILFPVMLLVHLLLLSARISLGVLLKQWGQFLPLMLMILVLRPLLQRQGETLWFQWRFIEIYREGVMSALLLALRLPLLVILCNVPLMTHRQNVMIRGLVALGLPYRMGLILILSLRFIPYFRESLERIDEAQRMRGLQLKGRGIRRILPKLVTLMVWALRTSQNLSYALETRGLGLSERPSFLVELKWSGRDTLTLLAALGLSAAIICFGINIFNI